MQVLQEQRCLAGIELRPLVMEVAADTIDQPWIDGIRAGWQKVYQGAQLHRITKVAREEQIAEALARIGTLNNFIHRLREDLTITKGIYHDFSKPARHSSEKSAKKLSEYIRDAIAQLNSVVYAIRFQPSFTRKGQVEYEETIESADHLMRELFKHLEKMLERHGDREWFPGDEDEPSWELRLRWVDWEAETPGGRSVVPNEVSLGRLKVKFFDTVRDPTRLRRGMTAFGTSGYRLPFRRDQYITQLDRARKLLRRRKLESKLWYGDFYIFAAGDEVEPGKRVGGVYYPSTDHIELMLDPTSRRSSVVAAAIIHELGHRLWFKFMRRRSRVLFRHEFSREMAVTAYGRTSPSEDFAELFAAYVMGPEWVRTGRELDPSGTRLVPRSVLTRGQHNRMTRFLQQHRLKREEVEVVKSKLQEQRVLAGIDTWDRAASLGLRERLSWKKTAKGYEMGTPKGKAILSRKGRQWFLTLGDRRIKLGPRASFDRAEGELKKLLGA